MLSTPPMCRRASGEAIVLEQRLGRGVAAAEGAEHLGGMLAAAQGEHGVAEAAADGAHLLLVVEADLLEGGEGVGRQDLGPLVRVVARRVAASEDVPERAEEAVLLQRRQHRHRGGEAPLHVEGGLRGVGRVVPMVQLHVERAEVELPAHDHARLECLLLAQLLEELARQRLTRLVVLGQPRAVDRRLVVAPVLHELRRQLDRVPLHTGDAGGGRVRHGGEHVLQSVARLVEERRHLREGHERRLALDRRRAVAGEVGHRLAVEHATLAEADAHPRTTTLVLGARVRVEVEGGDVLLAAGVEDLEELDVGVPLGRLAARLDDVYAEEAVTHAEEAVEHVGQREVRPQLLLLEAEGLLRQPLRPEGHVPQREALLLEAALAREGGELGELALGGGQRLGEQHGRELVDGLDVLRHLARHRHLGVRAEAEQLGLLLLEAEDLRQQRRVLLARARDEGAVKLLAHAPVLEHLHGRQVRRHVEAELPRPRLGRRALGAVLCGTRGEQRERRGWQPLHLGWVGELHRVSLRGVEQVVRVRGRQLGQLHLVGVELLLGLALETDARQLHRLQRGGDDALLRLIELVVPARRDGLHCRVDGLALGELLRRLHHCRLHLGVCVA
mmetsp:Transcript_27760/g.65566  ORF Transcript_27760/g.65566 Transcript_27760/m.65566 type:complete len:616 (+) Transcript_27760:208-2055(+)|eukprot:scaffold4883_cov62-Phaeocystis_antarctica.AAC.4